LVSSSAQLTQHRRHAVQFHLAVLTLRFLQGFAGHEDILDCRALQRRSARDLEVSPPIRIGCLPVALGDVQGHRLAGAQPLVPRRAMDALQPRSDLVDPRDVADRQPVDVQSLVSERH
jgi:hypothetical protein